MSDIPGGGNFARPERGIGNLVSQLLPEAVAIPIRTEQPERRTRQHGAVQRLVAFPQLGPCETQQEGTRMTRRSSAAPAAAPTIPKIPPTQVLSRLAALQAAPTATLKEQWRELFGKEPPPWNRAYIQSRLAYRIQELAYGGLRPETVDRLVALGEQLDGGNVVLRRIRADSRPLAGTRLVREWQGVQHVVTVRINDFEFEGRPYQSLSAIARHITGTRWNGWTFFGLRARGDV